MNYQESLDAIKTLTTKMYSDFVYRVATKGSMMLLESEIYENLDEIYENLDILQQLTDEKLEQESRKDNLVIGSRWECVCKSYGTVKILDVHPLSKNVTFGGMIFSRTEKIDDFILCFKPVKEEL